MRRALIKCFYSSPGVIRTEKKLITFGFVFCGWRSRRSNAASKSILFIEVFNNVVSKTKGCPSHYAVFGPFEIEVAFAMDVT